MTLYEFFSPKEADIKRGVQAALSDVQFSPVERFHALNAAMAGKALHDELASLLDISIAGVMLCAWTKYKQVSKYLSPDAPHSSEAVLLPLVEHSIESVHNPYVQISRGKLPLAKITFQVSLAIDVESLVLKIRDGRIQEVAAGRFSASGTLKCESITICEKKSSALNLPGSFVLTEHDEEHSGID